MAWVQCSLAFDEEAVTREELKARLLRPLKRELADGALDRVVAGGLEKLLQNLGQPFPEVGQALAGYRQMDVEVRKVQLEKAIELLGGQAAGNRAQGPGDRGEGIGNPYPTHHPPSPT
ncbi:MAG: hypothetical protein N2318_06760, partial [Meiothermus sp.]|nr:hypothetical protein [Meiothermus sp.]